MRKEFIFFIVGLLLFSLVLVDIYWWIEISSDSSKSFDQVKREYFEKFPNFIGRGHGVTLLNITFLAIAALFFSMSKNLNKLKILSRMFFVGCIIISIWQVFSLL